ncbi:MAG: response regulator [Gemmatimonadota bacterium]
MPFAVPSIPPRRLTIFVAIALLVSFGNLYGWTTNNPLFLSPFPTFPAMAPFTAELLLLATAGLLLGQRGMSRVGVAVLVVGLLAITAFVIPALAVVTRLHPFDPARVAALTGSPSNVLVMATAIGALGLAMILLARDAASVRSLTVGGMLAASAASGGWTVLVSYTVGIIEAGGTLWSARLSVMATVGVLFLGLALLERTWRAVQGELRHNLVRWWLLAAWSVALAYVLHLVGSVVARPDEVGVWPATLALFAVTGATLIAVIGLGVERSRSARQELESANAELRQREAQLARSTELLRAALDGSLDSFYLLEAIRDADGTLRDLRILDLNIRAADFLMRAPDGLRGASLCAEFPVYRKGEFLETYESVMLSGIPVETEFKIKPDVAGGAAQFLKQQIVKVGDGVAITSRDVTAARQLEEQFRHAQKMDAVGRVATGVAHDFNNLLTVIIGITVMMIEDEELSSHHRADLFEVLGAVTRGTDLTTRLLAFSRRQPIAPATIALPALVGEIVALTRRVLPQGIALDAVQGPSAPYVHVDRLLLEQALMNLILNARDAMVDRGTLTVFTEQVTLAAARHYGQASIPAGEWGRVTIRDTGSGMTTHVLEHLFEPFFTTKAAGKGTGLGLSTSFGIIRQANGHLVVADTGPAGTTFHAYLPAVGMAAAREPSLGLGPRNASGSERILVVDDDPAVRSVVRRMLSRAGYDVVSVESGEEAELALRDESPFALLVTDMVMPGIGGGELARRAVATHPDLRVLFISGYTDDEVIRDARMESGRAFVAKPFTAEEFLGRVRDLLDGAVTTGV